MNSDDKYCDKHGLLVTSDDQCEDCRTVEYWEALERGEDIFAEEPDTCDAADCQNTIGVVECWFDNGQFSFRIQACLSCRTRLQELNLLTVNRREDLPCPPRNRT